MIDQETVNGIRAAQDRSHAGGTSLAQELDDAGLLFTVTRRVAERVMVLRGLASGLEDWGTTAQVLARWLPESHQALTADSVRKAFLSWLLELVEEGLGTDGR